MRNYRYYKISSLNEQKVMKLLYDPYKHYIIFRDDASKLLEIDQDKYAKMLEIIGTEQAKVAATWLKIIKKYKNINSFIISSKNPALKELIANSKIYVDEDKFTIQYGDAPIAEIYFSATYFPELDLLKPNEKFELSKAFDILIDRAKRLLNNVDEYDKYLFDYPLDQKYNVNFNFERINYGFKRYYRGKNFNVKTIPISHFIKELNADKIKEIIYSIKENDTISIHGDLNMINLLDKAFAELDITKVKNIYIKKLIKLRKRFDIFTSLLFLTQSPEKFRLELNYENSNLPDHVIKISKKIRLKYILKKLKEDKANGLSISGFHFNPDGTIKIVSYQLAASDFDLSFLTRYVYS